MNMALTYMTFHLIFVLPPIFLIGLGTYFRTDVWDGKRAFSGLAVLLVLAFVYTTPWDNLLIAEGVWWYGEGTTLFTIGNAPVGEYLFFLLQPVLAVLWLFQLPTVADMSLRDISLRARAVGIGAGLAVSAIGFALLGTQSTYYMGAILFWGGPILAIQWGFGWPYLVRIRRTVALGVLVPAVYLCLIDRVALEMGIWVISDAHTTGLAIVGLPVEEVLFFFLTTVFAVQTLVLYMWLWDRVDRGEINEWKLAVQKYRPAPDIDG